jgi:uncharacterized protein (TIGR03067 family)
MRLGSGLIVAACVLVAGVGIPRDKPKKDLDLLQGAWVIVGKEFMGKSATKEELKKLGGEMVIKSALVTQWADVAGDKYVVSTATSKLNPKARPKRIDLTYTDENFKGEKSLAIYELKGDTLRVCYSMGNADRPTEFAGKVDGKALLVTYKRVKK